MLKQSLLVGALALLSACQTKDVFDPGWTRQVGKVDPALSSVQMIAAPAQARVNVPFTMVVKTLGSSSCNRVSDPLVAVSGLNVDITPYVEFANQAPACTDDLHAFEHSISVTVTTAGAARVRLHAKTLAGEDLTYDVPVTVTP